jgi:hypothetical protein
MCKWGEVLFLTVTAYGCGKDTKVAVYNHTTFGVHEPAIHWVVDRIWDGLPAYDLDIHLFSSWKGDPCPQYQGPDLMTDGSWCAELNGFAYTPGGPVMIRLQEEMPWTACLTESALVHELLHLWAYDHSIKGALEHYSAFWYIKPGVNAELFCRDPNCYPDLFERCDGVEIPAW